MSGKEQLKCLQTIAEYPKGWCRRDVTEVTRQFIPDTGSSDHKSSVVIHAVYMFMNHTARSGCRCRRRYSR